MINAGASSLPKSPRSPEGPLEPPRRPVTYPNIAEPNTHDIAARLAVIFAGRYRIIRLIGVGGMASVYLARHRFHQGLFAIKVLHPALAEKHELLARFQREGLVGARLAGHPNIALVVDGGESDGLHYLVMPYIAGEDLDHLLGRVGRFSFDDALLTAMQINEALLYAWSKGILHCDVTPGNIRLNEFGQFILVDFGLANMASGLQRRDDSAASVRYPGTPLYMSPERILGQRVDIRSDLYALGAILYELLTGEAAFRGDTVEEIEEKHLAEDRSLSHPDLNQGLTPDLNQDLNQDGAQHPGVIPVLRKLIARSAHDRFSDPIAVRSAMSTLMPYPRRPSVHASIAPEHAIPLRRRRLYRL